MWTEPRDRFCRLVVSTLHDAILSAPEGAPRRKAFEGLGEHFCDVASEVVSRHAKRHLAIVSRLDVRSGEPLPHVAIVAAGEVVRRTLLELIRIWEGRRYLLDGKPCELEDFLRANRENLTPEGVREVRGLRIGDRMIFGGRAWAESVIECVRADEPNGGEHAGSGNAA